MSARAIVDRWRASAVIDLPALADPAVRRAILEIIAADDVGSYHGLLRAILPMEAAYRADDADDSDGQDYYENLYACGLLLYEIGDVSDVPAMWAAKTTNMDTGCGFDAQMLVGAGVDATLNYLRVHGHDEAAQFIEECRAAGDFEELAKWRDDSRNYHFASVKPDQD